MTRFFEKLVKPLVTFQTPGAFLNGLRWMAIDETLFDISDTDSNVRLFGYLSTRKGTHVAFSKPRVIGYKSVFISTTIGD